MTEKPAMQRFSEIASDAWQIVNDEKELALAKIKPQAKEGAVGAGLFGAAGVLALNTIPLFSLMFVALFAWLYTRWWSVFPAIVLGFLTEAVLLLLLALVLVLMGKGRVARFGEIKPTLDQSKQRLVATVDMAKAAIESGQQKVAALESADRAELDRAS